MSGPALISAALPHHGTHAFVRLLRVCALEAADETANPWAWLRASAEAGTPVPRAVLAARAAHDPRVLRAVCAAADGGATSLDLEVVEAGGGEGGEGDEAAAAVSTSAPSSSSSLPRHVPASSLSFYAVTLCEALDIAATSGRVGGRKASGGGSSGGVGDAAVRALLPGVLAGLARGAGLDRRGAATMVAAALARSARLADAVVNGKKIAFFCSFSFSTTSTSTRRGRDQLLLKSKISSLP